MLSFLLNQLWIGSDYFLLNFFVTTDSVWGLQVTVLIRVFQIYWNCLLYSISFNVEPCLGPAL